MVVAYAPIVLVTHPSVGNIESITKEQILGIFAGEIMNWVDLGGYDMPIVPILQEKGDTDRLAMEERIAGFKEIKVPAHARVVSTSDEVPEVFQDQVGAISYATYSDVVEGSIKGTPLRLDGIGPSDETFRSGRYWLGKPIVLVTKGAAASDAIQAFLDFALTDVAQFQIASAGFLPKKNVEGK